MTKIQPITRDSLLPETSKPDDTQSEKFLASIVVITISIAFAVLACFWTYESVLEYNRISKKLESVIERRTKFQNYATAALAFLKKRSGPHS